MKISTLKMKKKLKDFKCNDNYLEVFKRHTPDGSDAFFKGIFSSLTSVYGFINYKTAKDDILELLESKISSEYKMNPFYEVWINDMANICKCFCSFLTEQRISFWIGSKRGCKRYHIDLVAFRLLVTYAGQGTEILPNHAANRTAFLKGMPNNKIVKNKSAIRYLNRWDIAIFKGGNKSILHRTPNSALFDGSSILMRLDKASFLEDIKKINVI